LINRNKGKELNTKWKVNAIHALYREDGKWYHKLKRFPGALFDKNGYIIFNSEDEYINCKYINHGEEIHIYNGIKTIPGYIAVMED
jgi:5-methylcytosine-specific restriction protein A